MRYVVVGGGILGLATARRLRALAPDAEVALLEKESSLAAHQSSHNSGVVHAGIYYEPGSLKARLCTRGRELLKAYCAGAGIAYVECGKVVVAADVESTVGVSEVGVGWPSTLIGPWPKAPLNGRRLTAPAASTPGNAEILSVAR